MRRVTFLSLFFFPLFLFCLPISNPSDPKMHSLGVIFLKTNNISIRTGYLYTNLYNGKFEDKMKIPGSSTPSDIQMNISAALINLNFFQRLDLLAILGTSDLQIDQTIYTDRNFLAGCGLKWLMFNLFNLDFALDGKFFQTEQSSTYFVVEKEVYYLKNKLIQTIRSYEASLGFSYSKPFLKPYVGATFLYSEILPNYKVGFLKFQGYELDFDTNDAENRRFFGLAVGMSFLNKKNQSSITLESKMFNENSISLIGQIRF